jgi:type II secretory ATPase GspE/PulE/Tfp pilus assembly ATPase PilB-like protein
MWQRFTEKARKVIFFAQEEAGRLGNNYLHTEHLLLGLVRENDTAAARILERMGVSLESIRAKVEKQVKRGKGTGQDIQLSPRAKRVIDLAYDEARQMNNNYIGTEHLLLGLVRESEGPAARVLKKLGVDLDKTRLEASQMSPREGVPKTSGNEWRTPATDSLETQEHINEDRRSLAESVPFSAESDIPVIRLANTFLMHAVMSKASDMYVEMKGKHGHVRYRIGGEMSDELLVPANVYPALIECFKVMAEMDPAKKDVRQEGRIRIRKDGRDYCLYVECLPAPGGEKLVCRLETENVPEGT